MADAHLSAFLWSIGDVVSGHTLSADGLHGKRFDYIGYEIPFNRHFYVFKPPRLWREIDAELKGVTDRMLTMIGRLS